MGLNTSKPTRTSLPLHTVESLPLPYDPSSYQHYPTSPYTTTPNQNPPPYNSPYSQSPYTSTPNHQHYTSANQEAHAEEVNPAKKMKFHQHAIHHLRTHRNHMLAAQFGLIILISAVIAGIVGGVTTAASKWNSKRSLDTFTQPQAGWGLFFWGGEKEEGGDRESVLGKRGIDWEFGVRNPSTQQQEEGEKDPFIGPPSARVEKWVFAHELALEKEREHNFRKAKQHAPLQQPITEIEREDSEEAGKEEDKWEGVGSPAGKVEKWIFERELENEKVKRKEELKAQELVKSQGGNENQEEDVVKDAGEEKGEPEETRSGLEGEGQEDVNRRNNNVDPSRETRRGNPMQKTDIVEGRIIMVGKPFHG